MQARLPAQVAAYAAARMPGCYAAVARVFDELRQRLPDLAPRSMLDFGAGPGTAVWAAREARPLCRVHDAPCGSGRLGIRPRGGALHARPWPQGQTLPPGRTRRGPVF